MALEEANLRVLICSQPGIGEESAYQTLAVTEHWVHMHPDVSFLVLTDVSKFNRLDLPPHLDYIHIPSAYYATAQLPLRQQLFATTVAYFAPHVVVVQCGLTAVDQPEMTQMAHHVHQHYPQIRLVLSLWPANDPQNAGLVTNALSLSTYEMLERLYEQIWVYTPFPLLAYQYHPPYQPPLAHDHPWPNGYHNQ